MMIARDGLLPGFLPDELSVFQYPPCVGIEKVLEIAGERQDAFHGQCSTVQLDGVTCLPGDTGPGRICVLGFMDYLFRVLDFRPEMK